LELYAQLPQGGDGTLVAILVGGETVRVSTNSALKGANRMGFGEHSNDSAEATPAACNCSCRIGAAMSHCLATFILSALILALGGIADAQEKKAAQHTDPTQLSLEELVKAEIFSASKHWQTVAEAPSSISVVTADQIQKYGYRTLAEILRSVRGVYVINDRNYSYIGIRGFGRPGDYNTRMLLLIDGHRFNDNVYDGAYIGTEFPVDVELIDRVEVIRGPSSSLYGGSAFFGVINVVTKRGHDLKGPVTSFEAASLNTYKGRVSYGDSFRNGFEMLVSASFADSAGQHRLFYNEFADPSTNNGFAVNADGDRSHSFFCNLSFRDFGFQAVYGSREKGIPTAAYGTVFNDTRTQTTDEHGFMELRYAHEFNNKWDVTGRLAYDRYSYHATYVFDYAGEGVPPFVENKDFSQSAWWGTELNASKLLLEKHRLTLGLDYRDNLQQDQRNLDANPSFSYLDDRRDSKVWALYGQDEFRVRKDLIVNVGLRHDRYESFGGTTNPRFALIYTPEENTTLKLLYGQAFRPPNYFESFFYQANRFGPPLTPETIKTTEFVLERYLGTRYLISASGYLNRIRGLINQQVDANGWIQYANLEAVRGQGLEIEFEGKLSSGFEGRAAYTLQKSKSELSGDTFSNSPTHLAKLNLVAPLAKRRLFAGFEGLYSSSRRTLAATSVDGYFLANVTLLSQRVFKGVDISVGAYNLFNTRYADPGGEEHRQPSIQQDGRTWRLKLTYVFGGRR
jgi:iron complex outermembrane receptor protein